MERHTVSRLIGAPPGYVGFDQGGLLTDGVDQHPHCVLLLDEIEKAHPDLFNILLQVMDHGKLTDHNGKKVDFRNVILIMTTNAGASDMPKAGDRLRLDQARQATTRRRSTACSRRNSATGSMRSSRSASLPTPVIHQVVAEVRPAARSPACRARRHLRPFAGGDRLARRQGLRRAHGRPPAGRVIQEHIKKPLADEVLFGKLKKGGTVKVTVGRRRNGENGLKLEALEDQAVKPEARAAPKAKRHPEGRGAEAAAKPQGKGKGTPRSGTVPKVPSRPDVTSCL